MTGSDGVAEVGKLGAERSCRRWKSRASDDEREYTLVAMRSTVTSPTIGLRRPLTTREAILTGWLLCGVLDITAACLQAWIQAGRAPADVLRGVASALWGRAAMTAGP